ncbi:MAG: hypothetical protein AB7O52_07100 [Planctomycetota bacterium]
MKHVLPCPVRLSVLAVLALTAVGLAGANASEGARITTVNGSTTAVRTPQGGVAAGAAASAQPFGPGPGLGITNGDFALGLVGWVGSQSGGLVAPGQVSVVAEQAQLVEGDSFIVTLEQTFVVPPFPSTIAFDVIFLPGFDQSANFIPDAFEVSLLDAGLLPVVQPWDILATSFFNVQEDGAVNAAPGVIWDGTTATVDISALVAGQVVTLFFDYVNGDADTAGGVRVDNVTLTDFAVPGFFLRGDLDADALVGASDLPVLLELLWDGGATPDDCGGEEYAETADINDNEFVTIADYLRLRAFLNGGAAIPAPGIDCGFDPSDDFAGFDAPDPNYVVSVGDVTVDPPMASVDRDVFIQLLVDVPEDVVGFTVTLEFPQATLAAFDPLAGDPPPFVSALGTTAYRVEPGRITVGVWASNDGDSLLVGNAGTFQDIGEVRFHLADFAILPPLAWNPQPGTLEPSFRATLVDATFGDHHPTFFSGPVEFARGNSNNDGNVDIADPVFTLAYLFTSGPAPVCFDAADANNDSSVNIADAAYTLNFLFAGGAVIPPPYPACGNDVGPIDTLICNPNFCQ